MSLSVGIVGLPNVGKSTLFNALLKKQAAYVANFPFATIEPNIGVVPLPDERLHTLSHVVKESEKMDNLPPQVPATVSFVDIAGLIAGAHKGEGLGNKFLANIRETSVVCHVLRDFTDENIIKEGAVDPVSDLSVVETELALADLQTLEKQKDPGNTSDKKLKERWEFITRLKQILSEGKPARDLEFSEEERLWVKELSLLTSKPILIVINTDENKLKNAEFLEKEFSHLLKVNEDQVVMISAKIEAEIADLTDEEQKTYLADLGINESGLVRLIAKAFKTLGLINFLTAGEKEVRAWTINAGINAKEASGVIHTDFIDNFIAANVVPFSDFVTYGGWKNAKEKGKVRIEGKDYIVCDGDVVEFKIGTR